MLLYFPKRIIVDKLGVVTSELNPYFDLLEVKAYPSYADYRETKKVIVCKPIS
jgi:hypothetical protein